MPAHLMVRNMASVLCMPLVACLDAFGLLDATYGLQTEIRVCLPWFIEPEIVHWRGARYSVGASRRPLMRRRGTPGRAGQVRALHMDRNIGICHPAKPGVAQVVAAETLVAELGDHFISVRRRAARLCCQPACAA